MSESSSCRSRTFTLDMIQTLDGQHPRRETLCTSSNRWADEDILEQAADFVAKSTCASSVVKPSSPRPVQEKLNAEVEPKPAELPTLLTNRTAPALKTRICRHWQANRCEHGSKCQFAHGHAELGHPRSFESCDRAEKAQRVAGNKDAAAKKQQKAGNAFVKQVADARNNMGLAKQESAAKTAWEKFEDAADQVSKALSACHGSVVHVSLVEGAKGWTVTALVEADQLASGQEHLEAVAKNALSMITMSMAGICLLGFQAKPFSPVQAGFRSTLAVMADPARDCWDIFATGVCSSPCCKKQHPKNQDQAVLTVLFTSASDTSDKAF